MNARLPGFSRPPTQVAEIAIADLVLRLQHMTALVQLARMGLEIVRPNCSIDGELDEFFKVWDANFIDEKEIH